MKIATTQILLIAATLVAFSACNKGDGGGGGGGGNAGAQVAAIPGLPQGPIYAQGGYAQGVDQRYYCSIAGNSLSCAGLNFQGAACKTNSITFSSITEMCTNLTQIQQSECTTSSAITQVQSQFCSNVGPNGGVGGVSTPINTSSSKILTCDISATNGRASYSQSSVPIDLSWGKYFLTLPRVGSIVASYTTSGIRSTDVLQISACGIDGTVNASQSGYAGQLVQLAASNDVGSVNWSISCRPQTAGFARPIGAGPFTRYVCRGSSKVYGSPREEIRVSFPYNSSILNTNLQIGENISAYVSADGAALSAARIEFTVGRVGVKLDVQSSASLGAQAVLNAGDDSITKVNLVCGPQ